MSYFWMIIKGMFIGISNIIPGVSGGTMAVSLAVYDDLIFAITHLKKKFKESMNIILPLGIGAVLGVIFFSYLIQILLSDYTFPTAMAFVGLILGGLPLLYKQFRSAVLYHGKKLKMVDFFTFFAFFVLIIGMSLVQESTVTFETIEPSAINLIILFLVGMIAAATMVIPGISGSLVLMILGYYYNILNTLTSFFDSLRAFDMNGILNGVILLVPFGIGVLLGGFLISKMIEYLFRNQPVLTYSAILGLISASPFAIFLNTDAIGSLEQANSFLFIIIGIIAAVTCFVITYWLGAIEDPNQAKN